MRNRIAVVAASFGVAAVLAIFSSGTAAMAASELPHGHAAAQEKAGPLSDRRVYAPLEFDIGVPDANLQFAGVIDSANRTASYDAYLKLPFLPRVQLGHGEGALQDGVQIRFDKGVAVGTTKLYLQGDVVRIAYDVTELGKRYTGDVAAMRI